MSRTEPTPTTPAADNGGNAHDAARSNGNGSNGHIDPNFTQAVISLFANNSNQRAGHLGKYEYSSPKYEGDPVNGVDLWADFIKANPQDYYPPLAEGLVAERARDVLPRYVPEPVALAFLGIGNVEMFRAKDLRVTDKFNNVIAAHAFDINHEFSSDALREMGRRWSPETSGVEQGATTADIFNGFSIPLGHHHIHRSHEVSRLATMFGLTIFNLGGFAQHGFPTDKFSERLTAIRKAVGKGGYFVTTFDANADPQKIEKAYANQTAFATNLAHRINRDTPASVLVDKTEFRVKYHADKGVLAHYLTLHCDHENSRMPFRDGKYHINNSWKVSRDHFTSLVTKNKFKIVHAIEENGVVLNLLEATAG